MTIYNDTLVVALARLQGSPAIVANVRRAHLTNVPRDLAPAVYLIDGPDNPKDAPNECRTKHDAEFTVRLCLRGDDPFTAVAALEQAVMDRLHPHAVGMPAYPPTVCVYAGRITPRTEIADLDATEIDMQFRVEYISGFWSLE